MAMQHYHASDETKKNTSSSLFSEEKFENIFFQNKNYATITTTQLVPIPHIFPRLNTSGNYTTNNDHNVSTLPINKYTISSPMKLGIKMNSYIPETFDIISEINSPDKPITNEIHKQIEELYNSKCDNSLYYQYINLLENECTENPTKKSHSVLAAFLMNLNVQYNKLGNPNYICEDTPFAVRDIIAYLNHCRHDGSILFLIHRLLFGETAIILSGIKHLMDKSCLFMNKLFPSKPIKPIQKTTDTIKLLETFLLGNPEYVPPIHIFILMAEIYGIRSNIPSVLHDVEKERDVEFGSVLTMGIIKLFIGTGDSNTNSFDVCANPRQQILKPLKTMTIIKNETQPGMSVFGEIQRNDTFGESSVVLIVQPKSYEAATELTTKAYLSSTFPSQSLFHALALHTTFDTKQQNCIFKTSNQRWSQSESIPYDFDIEEFMACDLSIQCGMLEKNVVLPQLIAKHISLLFYGIEDVDIAINNTDDDVTALTEQLFDSFFYDNRTSQGYSLFNKIYAVRVYPFIFKNYKPHLEAEDTICMSDIEDTEKEDTAKMSVAPKYIEMLSEEEETSENETTDSSSENENLDDEEETTNEPECQELTDDNHISDISESSFTDDEEEEEENIVTELKEINKQLKTTFVSSRNQAPPLIKSPKRKKPKKTDHTIIDTTQPSSSRLVMLPPTRKKSKLDHITIDTTKPSSSHSAPLLKSPTKQPKIDFSIDAAAKKKVKRKLDFTSPAPSPEYDICQKKKIRRGKKINILEPIQKKKYTSKLKNLSILVKAYREHSTNHGLRKFV